MKDGWTTKTLDEVCNFTNGLWKGEKPPFLTVGVIRNTNFTKEGALDDSDIAYIEVEAKKFEKRRLRFGDIILEKSGGGPKQPVGRVVLFDKQDGDFSFSNFTAALRVRDPGEVDFRYLHKFLHWTYLSGVTEGIQSHSTGIRNLNGDAYKAIAFNYPPLPEQQRIVALLDEAFAGLATAKANAEQNLQNARALFESHLQSVFSQRGEGWVERRLGDILKTGAGGTPLKSKKEYYEGGTIPWLMSGEVSQGEVTVATKFITAMGLENSSARMFPPDTVLVAMYGATAGQVGILRFKAATNQAVCGILPSDRFIPEFLFYFLLSRKGELVAQATGNAQPNISQIKIKNIEVPLIPLIEQREIVAKFIGLSQETQRLTRLYERKLAVLEELKKSLLHQSFNGEL
jgi:type I restriction enzyme S subunit